MSQPIYSVYIKPPEISTFLEKLIQYKYWLAVNWALLTCSGTVLYCLNWWNLFSLLNLISFWPHLDEIPFARLHLFHSLLWGCLFQLARVVGNPKYFAVCNRSLQKETNNPVCILQKEPGPAPVLSPINIWSTPAPIQWLPSLQPHMVVQKSVSRKAGRVYEPFNRVSEK